MSVKEKLRKILLIGAVGLGLLAGSPMRPEEIEDLMHLLDQQKIAQVLREEGDRGDDLI